MVAFDASFLMLSIQPDAPAPIDPDTGHAVLFVADRVNQLLHSIGERGEVILIPTPVLSEILVHADAAGPDWLARIQRSPHFRVGDFDQRAAIEAANLTRAAMQRAGGKKAGSSSSWGKIKFDRQIVAIAQVWGASAIYSDDDDVARAAELVGIRMIRLRELPMPPESRGLA